MISNKSIQHKKRTTYILIYVEYKNQLAFYSRFIQALVLLNKKIIFITNKFSLFLYALRKNCKVFFTTPTKNGNNLSRNGIEDSIEILTNDIRLVDAKKLFDAVLNRAKLIIQEFKVEYIFIFNGHKIADKALMKIAEQNNIKTIYFELSNIPGKVFADPQGTNAASLLFTNIRVLESFNVSEKEYASWRKSYVEIKKNNYLIPQTKALKKINNPLLVLDEIIHLFKFLPRNRNEKIINKIRIKLNKPREIKKKEPDNNYGKYVFFPTQVANDTQLKIFSSYTNKEAIIYANNYAQNKGLKLIVKIHPMETNEREIVGIIRLKKELDFKISNHNTFSLISNAETIVTINSTVGLEALILNKDVVFLGETFYSNLTHDLLKNYICSYLINGEFFHGEDFDLTEMQKILDRATIQL